MNKVILISCGSFNPPTIMHMRLFELAKDELRRKGFDVLGGIMSPTHDAYGKQSLVPSVHRVAMVQRSLKNYNFVRCSQWETQQSGWTRTVAVLGLHAKQMKDVTENNSLLEESAYAHFPPGLTGVPSSRLMMICGADLLESFSVPGLWKPEDMEAIVRDYGLVVISREGSCPDKYVDGHPMLSRYRENIHIVAESIPNDISSTRIRAAVKRGESIKFLVADDVIDYIYKEKLYVS